MSSSLNFSCSEFAVGIVEGFLALLKPYSIHNLVVDLINAPELVNGVWIDGSLVNVFLLINAHYFSSCLVNNLLLVSELLLKHRNEFLLCREVWSSVEFICRALVGRFAIGLSEHVFSFDALNEAAIALGLDWTYQESACEAL